MWKPTAKPGSRNGSPLSTIKPMTTIRGLAPGIAPGLTLGVLLLTGAGVLLAALIGTESGGELPNRIWRLLAVTTGQAALSLIGSLALGVLLAWCLHHQPAFPGRRLLIALMSSAMVLPVLVVVLGLVTVFGRRGWLSTLSEVVLGRGFEDSIYGLGGIVAAHCYLNTPFVARAVLNRLAAIPLEQRKLRAALGLSPWTRFRLIEWPALRGALPGVAVIVFLLCFTSFAVVLTLGGSPAYNTLEVAIYEAVRLDFDLALAGRLALLQLVICGGLVLLASGFRYRFDAAVTDMTWIDHANPKTIQYAVIVLSALLFLAPLVAVVVDGSAAEFPRLMAEASFQRAFVTSLVIASLSSGLTMLMALLLAAARVGLSAPSRLAGRFGGRWLDRVLGLAGTLYLAVPALVVSLGLFLLVRRLGGDPLAAGPLAVVSANVMLALPFALSLLTPALRNAAERYDKLSFALDLRGWQRWRLVDWPMLRTDLGLAAAIAFCFSFGDLGVIALFGNQDFATLPWLLYQKMGSYRTDDAAGIALVLLVLSWSAFFCLPRAIGGRGHAAG